MRFNGVMLVAALGLFACSSAPKECGEAECKAVCAADEAGAAPEKAEAKVSEFEDSLVGPILDDIRGGVRPFSAEGIGVCKMPAPGEKGAPKPKDQCLEFLGSDAGELGEGRYMVRAELAVPNVGEPGTWKIQFDLECTTTRQTANGEQTSTSNYSREYDVRYAGKERGYRLQPLRTIESPSKGGKRECKYTITSPHPDGDKVYTGGWITPEAS